MQNNPIQFAVVREDPNVEGRIAQSNFIQNALLIGSGGCTAFHLKAIKPDLNITLIDPNPNQIDLIRSKENLLLNNKFSLDRFCHLNSCGNFESLFKMWRMFINEFVASPEDLRDIIFKQVSPKKIFETPYWATSFKLFFSDPLLLTMFGPNAIQHAKQGSYPHYFQTVFEKGITRLDRSENYFLHHIIFGHYANQVLPYYLSHIKHKKIEKICLMNAQEIKDFAPYDMISLSNIFDWMNSEDSTEIIKCLSQTMTHGSYFILRQLNNDKSYNLGPNFTTEEVDVNQDRSLFYNKITIYRRS